MDALPGVIETARLPLALPILPYLYDHRFEDRAVLPGVEALAALARAARRFRPDAGVLRMAGASFDKFLVLDPEVPSPAAVAELALHDDGRLRAALVTRSPAKHARMSRVLTHAALTFGGPLDLPELPLDVAAAPEGACLRVEKARIYPGLVGFGPLYRSLDELHLAERAAVGRLTTPVVPEIDPGCPNLLGSPFALDAALHAACIWGQRFAGIVALPVGFDRRRVYQPTLPGETYFVHVLPTPGPPGGLTFDLRVYDDDGRLRDACTGVRMREVSGGRMRPPAWVRSAGERAAPGRIADRCRAMAVIEPAALAPFAEKTLAPHERTRLANLRGRRRASYLAARLACKRLTRRLSGDDHRTAPEAIVTVDPGRPERPVCPLSDGRIVYACSVSHDRRFAVAVAAEGRVGVDVETLSERVLKSRALYLQPAEAERVGESPLGEIAAAVRAWSIKEAVAKALDIPLAAAWQRVEVTAIGAAESRLSVEGRSACAVHDEIGPHVFTLVVIESSWGL